MKSTALPYPGWLCGSGVSKITMACGPGAVLITVLITVTLLILSRAPALCSRVVPFRKHCCVLGSGTAWEQLFCYQSLAGCAGVQQKCVRTMYRMFVSTKPQNSFIVQAWLISWCPSAPSAELIEVQWVLQSWVTAKPAVLPSSSP